MRRESAAEVHAWVRTVEKEEIMVGRLAAVHIMVVFTTSSGVVAAAAKAPDTAPMQKSSCGEMAHTIWGICSIINIKTSVRVALRLAAVASAPQALSTGGISQEVNSQQLEPHQTAALNSGRQADTDTNQSCHAARQVDSIDTSDDDPIPYIKQQAPRNALADGTRIR